MDKIECRSCQAPIMLIGNQWRCQQLICEYCGTVMDAREDFKALYAFTQIQKNTTDLRIGMRIEVFSVPFIVSGFVIYQARSDQHWIKFQLYSASHGYALLIIKNDVKVFLRRTFYLPDKNIWQLSASDAFELRQQRYDIESFSLAQTYYAAGHLTESIQERKRSKHCFACCDHQWFYSQYQRHKVEHYKGFQLP